MCQSETENTSFVWSFPFPLAAGENRALPTPGMDLGKLNDDECVCLELHRLASREDLKGLPSQSCTAVCQSGAGS